MFDFKALLDTELDNKCYTSALADGSEFIISRMSGMEFSDFISIHQKDGLSSALILSVLSKHVFFGDDPVPIREKKASVLLNKMPNTARALAMHIFSETAEFNEHIKAELESAEKN